MSIRLLALDVDGTLLNSKTELTPATVEALRDADAHGIQVVIATGRLLTEFTELAEQLPMMRYTVTCTGTQVLDLKTGRDIYRCALTADQMRHLYAILSPLDAFFQVFSDHDNRLHDDAAYVARAEQFCGAELARMMRSHHVIEPDLSAYIANYQGITNKVHVFFADPAEKARAIELLKNEPFDLMDSMPSDLEILPQGVDKAVGLSHLAAHLGLDRSQIMAMGDGGNDAAMLRYAGLGVAMKNASDEAKAAADQVLAYTNDEDGVARAVEAVLKHGTL